ncbi:hypothetical protein Tco_0667379 [Tanacetum coccineum]
MSTSNQQTLADSRANDIPWESRFRRFLDNNLEDGEQMWDSIEKGPYKQPMIPNPDNPHKGIIEPLSKMTKGNKKQYIANVKFMNYILQAIPNDIYNSVDACTNAKDMWERIKRLMFSYDVTSHVRHSRLMDEFDKFTAKELQGDSQKTILQLHDVIEALSNYLKASPHLPIIVLRNVSFITANRKRHYARDFQKPRVRDAKYFREQMLLAMKDEARSNLKDEENDFMLDNFYGDETLEELTTAAVSESIPCSPECKIVGKILLDHPLSYALTATADIPAVYLQYKQPQCDDVLKNRFGKADNILLFRTYTRIYLSHPY